MAIRGAGSANPTSKNGGSARIEGSCKAIDAVSSKAAVCGEAAHGVGVRTSIAASSTEGSALVALGAIG